MAGSKTPHWRKSFDVSEVSEQWGLVDFIIVLSLQHSTVFTIYVKVVNDIMKVRLKKEGWGYTGFGICSTGSHLGLQIKRHYEILIRSVPHVIQLLHYVRTPVYLLQCIPQTDCPL